MEHQINIKVIAVAGATASGKTSFAECLSKKLEHAAVLSLDNYYINKPDHVPLEQYNFDVPNAFDFKEYLHAIENLKAGIPVQVPQYQYGQGKRSNSTIKLNSPQYLIIEGLYVLMHASIRSLINYSFFLESPPDVLLGRRVLRDMRERNATAEYSIYQYFTYARPAYYTYVLPTKQYANMVVTNDYQSSLELFVDDFLSKYHF